MTHLLWLNSVLSRLLGWQAHLRCEAEWALRLIVRGGLFWVVLDLLPLGNWSDLRRLDLGALECLWFQLPCDSATCCQVTVVNMESWLTGLLLLLVKLHAFKVNFHPEAPEISLDHFLVTLGLPPLLSLLDEEVIIRVLALVK